MSTDTIVGFAGGHQDPITGGYLLGNGYRMYMPALMRFSSGDSVSPFEGGGINRYAYCGADPVNNIDPSGHISFAVGFLFAFGGALALGLTTQIPSLVRALRTGAEELTADAGVVTQEMGTVSRSVDRTVEPTGALNNMAQSYAHPNAHPPLAPSVVQSSVAEQGPRARGEIRHFDVPDDSIESLVGRQLDEATGFLAKSKERLEEARVIYQDLLDHPRPIKQRNDILRENLAGPLFSGGRNLDDARARIVSVDDSITRFNPELVRRMASIRPEYLSIDEQYNEMYAKLRDWKTDF
jgi:RHS repeat-associated protein